jgi:hypothetical protein
MNRSNKYSPEVRERAVRLVQEHRAEYPSLWAAPAGSPAVPGCGIMRDVHFSMFARVIMMLFKRDMVSGWRTSSSLMESCRLLTRP